MKHNPKFVCLLLATIVLCVGFCGLATAQEITGSIVGTVKDANGAAVKGATVTLTDPQKKEAVRTTTTNDDGEYSARDLHSGMYDVAVEASGFKRHISSKVQVDVGTPRTLNIGLEVGSVAEVVTVEANPVAVELTGSSSGNTLLAPEVLRARVAVQTGQPALIFVARRATRR